MQVAQEKLEEHNKQLLTVLLQFVMQVDPSEEGTNGD